MTEINGHLRYYTHKPLTHSEKQVLCLLAAYFEFTSIYLALPDNGWL